MPIHVGQGYGAMRETSAQAQDGPDDTVPDPCLPSGLLAAALGHHPNGITVRLALNDGEVVAVTSGEGGDPNEWWAAIHRLTSGPGEHHVPD